MTAGLRSGWELPVEGKSAMQTDATFGCMKEEKVGGDRAALRRLYYRLKPLIPRRLQLALRRTDVARRRRRCTHLWPILEAAADRSECRIDWPDGKRFALVLTHDVDTACGQERCRRLMQLEIRAGFRSIFNFVPEHRYRDSVELRNDLKANGFEVGVHGLTHDGRLFESKSIFDERAYKINGYLAQWGACGFRAPAMHHNLEWIGELRVLYDMSTFDTDPFEPQSDGVETIFPFVVEGAAGGRYVELPYTLAQDFTLFVLMRERSIDVWIKKLDWIAQNGGMALVNTHPDYMCFDDRKPGPEEYPTDYYERFLCYIRSRYAADYWHALPRELAMFTLDHARLRCAAGTRLRAKAIMH
jgi:hypothetical protein